MSSDDNDIDLDLEAELKLDINDNPETELSLEQLLKNLGVETTDTNNNNNEDDPFATDDKDDDKKEEKQANLDDLYALGQKRKIPRVIHRFPFGSKISVTEVAQMYRPNVAPPRDDEDRILVYAICYDNYIRKYAIEEKSMTMIEEVEVDLPDFESRVDEIIYYKDEKFLIRYNEYFWGYDFANRELLFNLKTDETANYKTPMSEDGKFYVAMDDKCIKEYSLLDGKAGRKFDLKKNADCHCVNDDKLYVLSNNKGPVYEYDIKTGKLLSEIKIPANSGFSDIISWGSYLLGYGNKEKMTLVDLKTKNSIWTVEPVGSDNATILNNKIYTNESENIYCNDVATGKNNWVLNADFNKPFILDKNAVYCAISGSDSSIAKITAESDEILWQRNFGDNTIDDLRVFGYHALIACDSKIQEIDLRWGGVNETNAATVGQLAISKSSEVYVGSSKTMTKYDFDSGYNAAGCKTYKLENVEDTVWYPNIMVLNKDETMMFTADTGTCTVQQWHLASAQIIATYKTETDNSIRSIAISDPHLAIGTSEGKIYHYNMETGQLIETLENAYPDKHYNEIYDVLFYGDTLFSVDAQGYLSSWTNGVRKQILRADNDDITERGKMFVYRDHLFVALKHIFIVDLHELKVKKSIKCPDDTYAMLIAVINENLLVATEGKNLYCISLLLLEGKQEYLEAVPQWDNFTTLCKNQSEQLSKFRDSRDNTFLMYCVQFGTYEHVKYIVKNCPTFSVYEGNRYGECAMSFVCKFERYRDIMYWELPENDSEDDAKHVEITPEVYGNFLEFLKTIINYSSGSWRVIGELKDHIKLATIKSLALELIQATRGSDTTSALESFIEHVKDINHAGPGGNTLLHAAAIHGDVEFFEILLNRDDIKANVSNEAGDTALHCALRLPENREPPKGAHQDSVLRRVQPLQMRKLQCAKLSVTTNAVSKRPNIYKKNNAGVTAYDLALNNYDYCTKEMKKSRDEIKDRDALAQAKDYFAFVNEFLEILHERYAQSQRRRNRFAVKMFLTEAIHYLIFLLLLSSAAFLNFTRNDQYDYYFTKGITDALDAGAFSSSTTIAFSDIVSGDQVFEWLQNTLVPTLYDDQWYNGDTFDTDERFFVAGYNRFLGAIRVKQVRVEDDDCRVAKSMKADVPFCYQNSVSKFSFGPNNMYKWQDDGEESSFRSTYSHSIWGSGGYIEEFNMSMSAAEAVTKINELSTNKWIDKGTRVIVISMTVYNPNINRLGSVRMIVEVLTGGEAFPSIQVTPMKALNYADASDLAQTVLELICLTYVAIEFFYRELLEIKNNIANNSLYDEYLVQSWNYYEWSIIGLTVAVAITRITNGINLGILSYEPNGPYLDTQSLGDRFIVGKALFAILVLLCFLRGLKLLRIPPFTGPVTQSIMDSIKARTVIVFMTLFILIIFSYSLAFSIAFGAQLFNYRTIGSSFITLIRMAFGDINYDELEQTNYVLGPILFITFVFFVTLVLMNLLVAILSEVYMNSQQQNEAAWERYITKLWIENVENPNAFFLTKFISSLLHHTNRFFHYAVLKAKYQFQQYQSKRKSQKSIETELALSDEYQISTEIEYEDADLDELAEQLREKRTNKTTNDVFTQVSALEKKVGEIEPLKTKIDAMDAKMNRIEKLLTQLADKKKKL